MISQNEPIVFDLELLGADDNISFLFAAKHLPTGKVFKVWGDDEIGLDKVQALINNPKYVWVSFNGLRFDAPVLAAVLGGRSLSEVKRMANEIITSNKAPWMSYRDYLLEPLTFDHIDLIEVAPGVMVNLKLYSARMGMKSLIDLPYRHDTKLTEEQRAVVAEYCENDLAVTEELWNNLQEAVELREHMTETYRIDLRSKSDAQMAEAIVAKQLGIRTAAAKPPAIVRYKAPAFIQPKNMILIEMLERVQRHEFKVDAGTGSVELPPFMLDPILIGKGRYQMGIGGLHSQHDRCQHWVATPKMEISDFDVGSFYPNIMVNAGVIPRSLGLAFVTLFRGIIAERMKAKREGRTIIANSMKIMLNGTFGKLGSKFSKVYSPDLLIAVTLTGQFYLLGLIELIIENGGHIISANTDGVCVSAPPTDMAVIRDVIAMYGWLTNFEFEETQYRSIAIKDVNNYLAVKTNGKVKAKGIYAGSGLQKNPTNEVCTLAAQAYLATGRSVESFIREHLKPENFADFTQSRSVTGGAIHYSDTHMVDDWFPMTDDEGKPVRGQWYREAWVITGKTRNPLKRVSRPAAVETGTNPVVLGRVARWYYCTDPKKSIHYMNNDNRVPKSEASQACLILPDTIPADLDVDRYIDETKTNLRNMGVAV